LARPTFSAEEAEFFQKVKTYIGNKATYNAFLKVLNLFSQQIVDQNILVSRVESFIGGHAELFDWFKQLVGYEEEEQEELDNNAIEPRTSRTPRSMPNYPPLQSEDESTGCGPSYRRIANKAWQDRSCSGRDALCWDVLNDTYISHPTWASEDTGYVAAKKNQYEEALHRVEEERYDYDLNIEANLNAMAILEPIAKKLSAMSPEEKANYRLSSDQLASTATMYQRILKKIYGTTKGLEMIELLYSNPSQTVPIVLRRLKQKDDEWKRAQREWNKIWREVERKNFWKSLDYQGITFKINDRKAVTAKSLVAEAEKKQPQGPFIMNDAAVFKDVSRLVHFYLTKQPVYNPEDCLTMRLFLQHFCSAFFDVADVEPSNAEDIVMEDVGVDDDSSSIQSDNTTTTTIKANAAAAAAAAAAARSSRRARRGRGQLNDNNDGGKLRKDVLTRNLKKKSSSSDDDEDDEDEEDEDEEDEEDEDENDSQNTMNRENDSINVSGDDDDDDEEDDEEDNDDSSSRRRPRRRRVAASRSSNKRSSQQRLPKTAKKATITPKLGALIDKVEKSMMEIDDENQKTYNFFGDNSFYCFFRLYQILYERLTKMKSLDAEFRNDPEKSRRAYEEARDLGITPKRFKGKKNSLNGFNIIY
jgi:paired amphipathic helix protein Sin3a